jgi:glucose-6-phosphate isomerase, archaeal
VKSDSRAASAGCAPSFDPGLDMQFPDNQMDFHYGHGIFGPKPKYRSLDSIRPSLRDPSCTGPDPVYAIAMDVGRTQDLSELKQRMLLALLST